MEPFKQLVGIVAPLDIANVDTDAIIPKQFLKRIEKTGYGEFLFYDWRYVEEGVENPEFILNQRPYRNSSILLTRKNFGCGSSREHAPWALEDFGFRVVIAPTFADIFYNNCFKNGILPIRLPEDTIQTLFENTQGQEGYQLHVDLEMKTLSDDQGLGVSFEIDGYLREMLLKGLDEIGTTVMNEGKIEEFESNHRVFYRV